MRFTVIRFPTQYAIKDLHTGEYDSWHASQEEAHRIKDKLNRESKKPKKFI